MAQPNNILVQVQTYQMAELAYLVNQNPFIGLTNKKFKDFNKLTANLGDTVTFDLAPRFQAGDGLVVNLQPANQRLITLTASQAKNVAYSFTSQQYIFDVEDYMVRFGISAMKELGNKIEADVASACVKSPYRFYGSPSAPINSYQQLAQALMMFRNYGADWSDTKAIITDVCVPSIINSGLAQFAPDRNNEDAKSWMLSEFDRCEWYRSNQLPIHYAGTEGNAGTTLTVVSVTYDSTGAVTAITFSGTDSANDPNSIALNDSFEFQDGVSGVPNVRFLTFIGHTPSSSPVQFRATAAAGSTGGSQVTVSIYPPLQVQPTADQNITTPIVAGMQCKVLPDHRAGVIWSGDQFYLAMPQLPDQSPFMTGNAIDEDSGVSFRHYFGAVLGQNQNISVRDCIYGYTLVPENSMKIVFPI